MRVTGSGIAGFDRLAFNGRASGPLGISVQLRDEADEVWKRSVYLGPGDRPVVVPFSDFRPATGTRAAVPDLQAVRSILFVVDLTNTNAGASGRINLRAVRLER